MRAKSMVLGLAAMGLATTPIAASAASARESAGVISATSGATFVARGGSLMAATPSMQLFKGDRVVTRSNGSANVAMDGCNVAVGVSSMATVSTCSSTKTAEFARAGYEGDSSSLRGRGRGGGFVVAIVAAVAIIIGIVIVVRNNNDRATSP